MKKTLVIQQNKNVQNNQKIQEKANRFTRKPNNDLKIDTLNDIWELGIDPEITVIWLNTFNKIVYPC